MNAQVNHHLKYTTTLSVLQTQLLKKLHVSFPACDNCPPPSSSFHKICTGQSCNSPNHYTSMEITTNIHSTKQNKTTTYTRTLRPSQGHPLTYQFKHPTAPTSPLNLPSDTHPPQPYSFDNHNNAYPQAHYHHHHHRNCRCAHSYYNAHPSPWNKY